VLVVPIRVVVVAAEVVVEEGAVAMVDVEEEEGVMGAGVVEEGEAKDVVVVVEDAGVMEVCWIVLVHLILLPLFHQAACSH